MANRLPAAEVERIIRQVAAEEGAADLADILVATAGRESGLDNTAPGDRDRNGTPRSWGPFQENDGGRGAGIDPENRQDVAASARRAVAEFKAMRAKYPNADPGTLAVYAQRPREDLRADYIRDVNQRVAQMQAKSGTQPMANGQAAQKSGTYVFPVRGYQGKEIPPHWGSNDKGARGGADIFAAVGTPVQSMTDGVVQWVNFDKAGGNNVGVLGDDGNMYYYAHMRDPSGVKAGARVRAGQDLGVVGQTGNAAGTSPHLHIGIGKSIRTGTGALGGVGADFDATTLLNQSLKGGGGYQTVSNTASTRQPPLTGGALDQAVQDKVNGDRDVLARQQRVRDAQKVVDGYQSRLDAADADIARLKTQYGDIGPDDKHPPKFEQKPKPGAVGFTWPNGTKGYYPWEMTDQEDRDKFNADITAWDKADKEIKTLRTTTTTGEGAAFKQAQTVVRQMEEDFDNARKDAEARYRKELTEQQQRRTHVVGDALVDDDTGEVVYKAPQDIKPGDTFDVAGVGRFKINPDGSADLIAGTAPAPNRREIPSVDENGKPITIVLEDVPGVDGQPGTTREVGRYPRQPSAADRNRIRVIDTLDENNNPITALVDDDQGGKIIAKYPREPKAGEGQITAPRDTKFIVRRGADGKLIVEDNPNYDATTGSLTGTTSTGRVYRVGVDGKAQVTDVLTPEERAVYDEGKLADIEKTKIGNITGLLDSVTKLNDTELKRQQQELWANVQKVVNDPKSTPDQIIGAVQAGAKDADEWQKVLTAYVNQKQQEEVGRHNRVTESVSIQEADRQLREGLYRDINETRNQRQLAQGRSNEAISDSGIIGMANSMNVLSAMAPQVGTEGIKRAGTLGLGVGGMAINPVVDQWEAHQAELKRLQHQMPAVRLANGNAQAPNFSMPRGTGAPISPNNTAGVTGDVIKTITDRIRNLGSGGNPPAGGLPPGFDPSVAHPVPQRDVPPPPAAAPPPEAAPPPAPEPEPEPAPPPPPPPPPPPEEEDYTSQPGSGIGLGGGFTGSRQSGRPRFQVPGKKKRAKVGAY